MSTKPFDVIRVTGDADIPPPDDRIIDTVVLDMNAGVPNLGHDSLVHAIHESGQGVEEELDVEVRVLSIDVRRAGTLPLFDLDRFRLFVGTGGPGHLDPRLNDGVAPWTDGIIEDPAWEMPLFALFDRIAGNERVGLFAFCHSFGLLCRWSGIAEPAARKPAGAMSTGIVSYTLTREAVEHPWFSRFVSELRDPPRFRVLDSRWFDLVPTGRMITGATVLAHDTIDDREPGRALTMIELARSEEGEMPRILAANHHPEVVDEQHLLEVVAEKVTAGEVDESWARNKVDSISRFWSEPFAEDRVRLTSRFTLLEPLAWHLRRIALARAGSARRRA